MPGNIWPSWVKPPTVPTGSRQNNGVIAVPANSISATWEAVIDSMKQIEPRDDHTRDEIRKAIDYFEKNKERMRYASFRSQGLFVGSGVMEAGCKTIVGQRLKPSGMRWTVSGANRIIALRCWQLSGRWEEFWETRSAGQPLPTILTHTP